MPFTLSHAAAAWPFRRTRLEFSALVTGCFAPDFAYFIFLRAHGAYGHTVPGIFVFDLPVSLVVLWLFHAYVKQPATMFLPRAVRSRMNTCDEAFTFWPPSRLANIVLSILVGTCTHIAWDSFTHNTFWPYRHLSILRKMVQVPVLGNVGVFKLLQYGSTMFGLVFLAIWILHWYRTTQPRAQWVEPFNAGQRRAIVVMVPVFAICASFIRVLHGVGMRVGRGSLLEFVGEAGISGLTFFCIGLLVCGVLLRKRAAAPEESPRK
ncbi:MAG: DUF4184 family protein [Terracidiphilus sp.]